MLLETEKSVKGIKRLHNLFLLIKDIAHLSGIQFNEIAIITLC